MAYIEIFTTPDKAYYEERVDLEGDTFRLIIRYNTRSDNWMLDVYSSENEAIIQGVKMVPGVLLLSQVISDIKPLGDLFIVPFGTKDDPGKDTMGKDFILVYRESTT